MKFLVDKLPSNPNECMCHIMITSCSFSTDKSFVCNIGEEGFECPYLREFKATATESTICPNVVRNIPIELK